MNEPRDETPHQPKPSLPSTPPPTLRGLINRLKLPQPRARRIAIGDLLQRGEPEALAALLAHLPKENDAKARLKIVEGLGERRYAPAAAALAALRDASDTPADLAHAATIAFDRIERAANVE